MRCCCCNSVGTRRELDTGVWSWMARSCTTHAQRGHNTKHEDKQEGTDTVGLQHREDRKPLAQGRHRHRRLPAQHIHLNKCMLRIQDCDPRHRRRHQGSASREFVRSQIGRLRHRLIIAWKRPMTGPTEKPYLLAEKMADTPRICQL